MTTSRQNLAGMPLSHPAGTWGLAGFGMGPLVAHCHLALAKLSRRAGAEQEANEHLAAATAQYRRMQMLGSLQDVEGVEA